MGELSERRLKENEVIFREANQLVQEFVTDVTGQTDRVLSFYCECSDADCRQRIPLTIKRYRQLHGSDRQFVILPGHETPKVERVLRKEKAFAVVEKFGQVPPPEAIDLAISRLTADEI